jgi:hypothetical protein
MISLGELGRDATLLTALKTRSSEDIFALRQDRNTCVVENAYRYFRKHVFKLIRHASIRTYSAFVEAGCTLGFSVSGWCCNLSVGLEGPGKNTQSP